MAESTTGRKYRVTKMVEARRLNPNSGIPLTEPPTALPFGAMLDNVREERDVFKFTYLGKPYQCLQTILRPAMEPFGAAPAKAAAVVEEDDGGVEETVVSSPVAVVAAPVPAVVAADAAFQWETVATSHGAILRAKVPGGWLVMTGRGTGLAFVPDAGHKWDGATLE
ncbi:MAG TPA: hypothetical protein PLF84_15105 [Bryobacteraceae bacterium]|nr:hypothetical protein [Bryobacterales bacterium]HRJ20375.1 hypothetical protein [Bryobacteraceae bacterium]